LKVCREGERAGGAADGDDFVFGRLAHYFNRAFIEFRQFSQEQYATMCRAGFAKNGKSTVQVSISRLFYDAADQKPCQAENFKVQVPRNRL